MKKIIAVLLAVSMLFILSACGKAKASKVTIDAFQNGVVKEINKDATLKKEKTDEGYTFKCSTELIGAYINIKGTANDQEFLTSFTATMKNCVNTDYFMTCTKEQIILDIADWENVPQNKLTCDLFLYNFTTAVSVVAAGESPDDGIMDVMLNARGGKSTHAGWEYSIAVDKANESVTLDAVFVG